MCLSKNVTSYTFFLSSTYHKRVTPSNYELSEVELPAHSGKTGQARLGLPGNVDTITGSALTPVLESVAALPAGYPADLPAS